MKQVLSRTILKIFGWKIKDISDNKINKCVIILAPHTSNYDFIIGRLAYFSINKKIKFLIKKEFFKFPMGRIFTAMGGIPVDRSGKNNLVGSLVQLFNNSKELTVILTPEGTRSYVSKWKKGFYLIAERAKVPILLGYLDYERKEGGIGKVIYPSGNFEEDFKKIEDFYRDKTAKHPENFNLSAGRQPKE